MDSELAAFAHANLVGETATHPLACLAPLLLVAGNEHAPRRALPDSTPDAYSDASNRGFQVE